jgi:hypothetical protein
VACVTAEGQPGVLDTGYVIQVVDGVVDEVAGERLDSELGAVAAAALAGPLVAMDRGKARRDRLGGLGKLGGHHSRILLAVAPGDGAWAPAPRSRTRE